MKIPHFVGCKNIPLTKEEVQIFDKVIRSAYEPLGFIVTSPTQHGEWPYNPERPNIMYRDLGIKTTWDITLPDLVIGRNTNGDRIYFNFIRIEVCNRENAKGETLFQSQYDCGINAMIVAHGCRDIRGIYPVNAFQYGTEIEEDFDFKPGARYMANKLTLGKCKQKDLRKMQDMFAQRIQLYESRGY